MGSVGEGGDFGGLLVLALEQVADLVEGGELQPAGAYGAGAGDPVTLALGRHQLLHYLGTLLEEGREGVS